MNLVRKTAQDFAQLFVYVFVKFVVCKKVYKDNNFQLLNHIQVNKEILLNYRLTLKGVAV